MAAIVSTPAVAANPQLETNDKDDAAGADENTGDKHSNTCDTRVYNVTYIFHVMTPGFFGLPDRAQWWLDRPSNKMA